MSIDYTAIPKCDEAYLELLEQSAPGTLLSIDKEGIADRLEAEFPGFERFEKDFAALAEYLGVSETEAREEHNTIELNWEGDGYIQIGVSDTEVGISCVGGHGGSQLQMLFQVFEVLWDEGLHVWDPIGGEFLPPGIS